jgi:2-dehydro-3-deoxyphosphooctonate aldolase (KDO 8-P synthase)
MRNVVEKIKSTDNEEIMLTERGTFFGYNYLVNDMRALPAMRMLGYPVLFDATHSVARPGGMGTRSGGERQYVPMLARAAVAVGVDGLFLEVHPDPDRALSDGPNMLRVKDLAPLLKVLRALDEAVRGVVAHEEFDPRPHAQTGQTLVNLAVKQV